MARELIVVVALAGFLAQNVQGQVVWTGANPNNNNWSQRQTTVEPGNWSTPNPPFPAADVVIGDPAPTVLDIDASVSSLAVSPAGRLELTQGNVLTLTGVRHSNDGIIQLSDGTLDFNNSADLSGTGVLELSRVGVLDAGIATGAVATQLTHGANHTIRGAGRIIGRMINNGLVEATSIGPRMLLDGTAVWNNATVRARSGATLWLTDAGIRQEGHNLNNGNIGELIAEDGGTVLLYRSTLGGGVFQSSGSGRLESHFGEFHSLTNKGLLVIREGRSNFRLRLENLGTINVDAVMVLDGGVAAGTGTIVLTKAGVSELEGRFLNDSEHHIRGSGTIDAELLNRGTVEATAAGGGPLILWRQAMTNHGLLQATTGATLRIENAEIDQRLLPGSIVALDGGIVDLSGSSAILDGQLATFGSGRIRASGSNVRLQDVVIAGAFEGAPGSTTHIEGRTLANEGTMTFGGRIGTRFATLQFDDALTLEGSGEIVLNRDSRVSIVPGVQLKLLEGSVIRGVGRLDGTVLNDGTIRGEASDRLIEVGGTVLGSGMLQNVRIYGRHSPGFGVADVTVDGAYEFSSGGTLHIELDGILGDADHVHALGDVILGGALYVEIPEMDAGRFPAMTNTPPPIEVLSSDNLISGEFERVDHGIYGMSATYDIVYESNRVLLENLVPLLIGDYNDSRTVEQGDLDLVLQNWGTDGIEPPSGWARDVPRGPVDQGELDRILLNWGNSISPLPAASSVPEPSTAALLLAIAAILCRHFARFLRNSCTLAPIAYNRTRVDGAAPVALDFSV